MADISFLIELAMTFGYVGVFLASLIGSASIFVPVPSFLLVAAAGSVLNPFAVGVVAGFGAAIGELIGYIIGLGLIHTKKKISGAKKQKMDEKEKHYVKFIKKWFHHKLGPLIIFFFAVTPLPDKIIGVVCGAIKYDVKKFFLAELAGKIVLHLVLAYIGFYGMGFIGGFF